MDLSLARIAASTSVAALIVLGAASPGSASTRDATGADAERNRTEQTSPDTDRKGKAPIRCLSLDMGHLYLCEMDFAGVKVEFLCDTEAKTCELHKPF